VGTLPKWKSKSKDGVGTMIPEDRNKELQAEDRKELINPEYTECEECNAEIDFGETYCADCIEKAGSEDL